MPPCAIETGSLTPEDHRELVEESAILPEVLADEDIRSLPSSLGLPTPDPALKHPNSYKGQHFGTWGEADKQFRPIDLGPGIWFGTRDVKGRLSGQYKPKKPRTAYNGRTVKYEGPRGTRPSFGVPKACLDTLVNSFCEVFFTEGYKKALSLASAGACAISLAGVDSWLVKPSPNEPGEPVEDFDAINWHGRLVWIVYDSDAVLKDGVRWAERRLTKELESRGAVVIVLRVPHASDGSRRGVDDYLRDRLAAGVTREDALWQLKGPALAELIERANRRPNPPTGTDGDQACQGCREHEAAEKMERHGPFSPATARIVKHLLAEADMTRTLGREKVALERKQVARLALGDETNVSAVTRAWKDWKAYQADPELAALLPFELKKRTDAEGHDHIDLYPVKAEAPRTRREEYQLLTQLPRLRARPGGDQRGKERRPGACPRCNGPEGMERRATYRCLNDACGHVYSGKAFVVGREHSESRTPEQNDRAPDLAEIHGDLYRVETRPAPTPEQNAPEGAYVPIAGQNAPAPTSGRLVSVAFTSRADQEAAAGPTYQAEPAPDDPPEPPAWQPPPMAPRHHLAWSPRRRAPEPSAGAAS